MCGQTATRGVSIATEDSEQSAERKALDGPSREGNATSFLPCPGAPLNLIPLTLEHVNDCALDVN